MSNAEGQIFYPILAGLQAGERVVSSGSFLVDAETRLNPAAGSIYFGSSSSSKTASAGASNVRPSTPEDPNAKIEAALATLSPADRESAQQQRTCPITGNRLGVMGPPLKVAIGEETVWLCCSSCKEESLKDPQATLAKVAELKRGNATQKEVVPHD
jgi:hypothetical protein